MRSDLCMHMFTIVDWKPRPIILTQSSSHWAWTMCNAAWQTFICLVKPVTKSGPQSRWTGVLTSSDFGEQTVLSNSAWGRRNWCYYSPGLRHSQLKGRPTCYFSQHPNQSSPAEPLLGYLPFRFAYLSVWVRTDSSTSCCCIATLSDHIAILMEYLFFPYCGKKHFNNACAHR